MRRLNMARIHHQVSSRDRQCKSQDRQCMWQDKEREKEQTAQTTTKSNKSICRKQDKTQENVLTFRSEINTTLH